MIDGMAQANDHDICAFCGHYHFLHRSTFSGGCDACDDPSVPFEKRCKMFQNFNGGLLE